MLVLACLRRTFKAILRLLPFWASSATVGLKSHEQRETVREENHFQRDQERSRVVSVEWRNATIFSVHFISYRTCCVEGAKAEAEATRQRVAAAVYFICLVR